MSPSPLHANSPSLEESPCRSQRSTSAPTRSTWGSRAPTPHTGFEVLDRERDVVQIGRILHERAAAERAITAPPTRSPATSSWRSAGRWTTSSARRDGGGARGPQRGDFLQAARAASGILPRVIPSEEEGRLIWLGVRAHSRSGISRRSSSTSVVAACSSWSGTRSAFTWRRARRSGRCGSPSCWWNPDPPTRSELQRLRSTCATGARSALGPSARSRSTPCTAHRARSTRSPRPPGWRPAASSGR